MKKILFSFLIGIMITSIAAETALGDMWNPDRQWGDVGSLSEVQGVFNTIGSSLNAFGDQSHWAVFEPTSSTSSTTYIATVSWGFPDIDFGIYDYDNPATKLELFSLTSVSIGDTAIMQFDQGADFVKIFDKDMNLVAQSTYFKEFGFYTIGTDHEGDPIGPYYTEDDLNPFGDARFLTYEAKGDDVEIGTKGIYNDVAHWYIAAESDVPGNRTANADFSDFIVQVESIRPVPVPAAVLLGILGLSVAGLKLRKYA